MIPHALAALVDDATHRRALLQQRKVLAPNRGAGKSRAAANKDRRSAAQVRRRRRNMQASQSRRRNRT